MSEDITVWGAPDRHPELIPEDSPLRDLFRFCVRRAFHETLGVSEAQIGAYIADLLADFAHVDNMYSLRGANGRRLREVAEMLADADVRLSGSSFEHEREVHRRIGDFTLFWGGIYPEALTRLRAPGTPDSLIDYVRQGKMSYYIVSTFDHGRFGREAALFRQLSAEFELYQYGLSLVRREWERMSRSGLPY